MPVIHPPPAYTPRHGGATPSRNATTKNRSISLGRSKSRAVPTSTGGSPKLGFFSSLRGAGNLPQLSKRMYKMIKSENSVINAYDAAGKERINVAMQLSEWGEQTGDDSVSDLSDKLGVLLSEIGTQEAVHAQALEDYRVILKAIRNTEASVQPSRDHKARIQEEIARLKYKDPQSSRIQQLEQELVRAEAENLVAEAQLSNITRSKLKEAYALQFAVVIERCEKQALLAKHGRRMLNLLDDTPIVPGSLPPTYEREREARQILKDAEDEIKEWRERLEEVGTAVEHPAFLGKAGLPVPVPMQVPTPVPVPTSRPGTGYTHPHTRDQKSEYMHARDQKSGEDLEEIGIIHPAFRGSRGKWKGKGKASAGLPYPSSEVGGDSRLVAVI